MFRDLLSSRWFQAGLAFFVLCVGGSLLYSWHVQRTIDAEFGKRPQPVVSPLKNKTETNTAPVDIQTEGVVNTPEETTDTPMSDETEAETIDETELIDMADAFLPDEMVSEEEVRAEDVFKTTPEGFPFKPYWDYSTERQENWSYDHKLLAHVLVKLWRQGTHNFTGGSIGDNGRVHPHYTNTLYVRWGQERHPDGTMRDVITETFGGARIWQRSGDIFELPPPSVQLIDLNSPEGQGIDPYTFLTPGEIP